MVARGAALRKPVEASTHTPLSGEVATYCRGLTAGERSAFLRVAIDEGDSTTMHAVLSRPGYLTGITKDMHASLTEQWNCRMQPDMARKLGLMQAARQKLDDAGSLFLGQVEKAMGVNGGWRVAQRLRAQHSSAMSAFNGA